MDYNLRGLYTFKLPKQPKNEDILFHDLPQKEQYWRRQSIPTWYDEERERELYDPTYRSSKKLNYIKREWERRLNGLWFFNNGIPTYITGKNYFFLNWCRFNHPENDGYPLYFEEDKEEFYFTELCFNDPLCLGYLKIGSRGTGKTIKESSILLEEITKQPRRRNAFIQSKTEDDAKTLIFQTFIVPLFKALPDFFQPIVSVYAGESGMAFRKPSVKGKMATKQKYSDDDELDNTIVPVDSKNSALDGSTAAIILQDEIGKLVPTRNQNAYERLAVNRQVVFRNDKKVGMLLCTTTVEELDKGGEECKKIWDESNPKNRTKNGYTISKLYKWYTPKSRATRFIGSTPNFDKYGFINVEKALDYQRNEREALKNNQQALASFIRKNSETEEEAFYKDGSQTIFNAVVLNERSSYLNYKEETVKGILEWEDGIADSRVVFRPVVGDNYKFRIHRHPLEHANGFFAVDGGRRNLFKPLNDSRFAIGIDPIDHKSKDITDQSRKSDAAAYVFMKFDYELDDPTDVDEFQKPSCSEDENGNLVDHWQSYNFVAEYVCRPNYPEDFYEDMLMLCAYYGCSMLTESQKPGLFTHFRQRGYGSFVMKRPKYTFQNKDNISLEADGIPATSWTKELGTSELVTHVEFHGHRIPFRTLVNDLLEYTPKTSTEHDASMAAMWTLVAAKSMRASQHNMALEQTLKTAQIWGVNYATAVRRFGRK